MAIPMGTRDAFGRALSRLGISYSNFVVVDAGSSEATRTAYFAREFPERFVQVGPSEADLVDTAAGLALCDKIVFAATYTMGACRAWEAIRNTLALDRLPVSVFGIQGGLEPSLNGAAHQALEDLAIFRAMPNMRVFVPCDAAQTEAIIEFLIEDDTGPAYIRLGRGSSSIASTPEKLFTPGKARCLLEGDDLTIAACGSMVATSLRAAKSLSEEGVNARVLDCASLKPLDEATILAAAQETRGIITVEEGTISGGLGSAVTELVTSHCPTRVLRLGVPDVFSRTGSPAELLDRFGLNPEGIKKAAQLLLKDA